MALDPNPLRRRVRGLLALIPAVTLCAVAIYLVYGLVTSTTADDLRATIKEILIFVLGALGSNSSSATSYYFTPDADELPESRNAPP